MAEISSPWIFHGDCIEWLRMLPDASIDAFVSDPPYGLGAPPDPVAVLTAWANGQEFFAPNKGGFMGRAWDAFVPGPELWREVFRTLKPGGHVVAFAATRTVDWTSLAMRLSGFDIRDIISWGYTSGFPKSYNVSKAIDDYLGFEREVIGEQTKVRAVGSGSALPTIGAPPEEQTWDLTAPASEEAKQWNGWGTALKPCFEPAVLARKPLEGTIAENVLTFGTGAINIDRCRFSPGAPEWFGPNDDGAKHSGVVRGPHGAGSGVGAEIYGKYNGGFIPPSDGRRWPGNIILVPKPSRSERERGTLGLPLGTSAAVEHAGEGAIGLNSPRAGAGRTSGSVRNNHPTVKPVRLMRWLCRLLCPPGGIVADPFTGSGTTGIAAMLDGFRFYGAEREDAFHAIASARVKHAKSFPLKWIDTEPGKPSGR